MLMCINMFQIFNVLQCVVHAAEKKKQTNKYVKLQNKVESCTDVNSTRSKCFLIDFSMIFFETYHRMLCSLRLPRVLYYTHCVFRNESELTLQRQLFFRRGVRKVQSYSHFTQTAILYFISALLLTIYQSKSTVHQAVENHITVKYNRDGTMKSDQCSKKNWRQKNFANTL